jgi:hypothetical protein
MKFMLQLKHWQMFLILLFCYWLQTGSGSGFFIARLVCLLVVSGWEWALGAYGQKLLAAKGVASKSTGLFVFNITYLCVFFILQTQFQTQYHHSPDIPQIEKAFSFFGLGYAIFAIIQTSWFNARTLSMIENADNRSGHTTVVYLLFLQLPIVGIWVIQPIVNNWNPEPRYHENDGVQKSEIQNMEGRAIP